MLSRDLKQLSETFHRWLTGQETVTAETMRRFDQDLRCAVDSATLLELGIDPNTLFALAIASETPNSNVTFLSDYRVRRVRAAMGASS